MLIGTAVAQFNVRTICYSLSKTDITRVVQKRISDGFASCSSFKLSITNKQKFKLYEKKLSFVGKIKN